MKQVLRTLDAGECIARGASLQAAIISPFFNVPAYQVEEINYYPIDCVWRFTDSPCLDQVAPAEEVSDNQRATLFKKGCVIPVTKSLNMTKKQNIELVLYNNPPVPGFEPLLARYLVKMQPPKEQDFSVKIKVNVNQNGLVQLDSASLNEDYMEEKRVKKEKKEEKKDMEVEGEKKDMEVEEPKEEEEVTMVKKTRVIPLKVEGGVSNE